MRKFFLFLLPVYLLLVGQVAWASEATFNWASGGNMGSNATGKVGYITLTGAANSASNAPAVTSNTLRIYAYRSTGDGASATFTADDGYKISAIEVTSSNGGTILKYDTDGSGSFSAFSFSEGVATVSDLDASSITLKNCQNSGKSNTTIQVSQVVITYASSSSTPSSDVAFEYSARSLDLNDASSFTQTATTADGYAEEVGASVTYSMTSNTAGATINTSTGEVTPTKAGSVTVQASAAAIDGKYLASSATYTLTVTDTREWDVTCHIGNNTSVESRTSGSALSLDNPAAICGMSFVGWSSTNNIASPTWVANTTKVTNDMELYAIFEEVAGEYSYHLVESNQADWRGDYLIAYSSTKFADGRTGGESGIGKNGAGVNPSTNLSGKVVNCTWGDTYNVTLEAKDDSDLSKGYVLKTKDGNYNYQTSNSNGIAISKTKATAANYPITVSFTSSSDVKLCLGGDASGAVFRYNSGSSGYFRYYKDGGQNAVYLYKRTEDVAPVYSLGLTATFTIASACTDGEKYYATYSNSSAFIVPDGLTVTEISVVDGELLVDEYSTGDIVPANTGVMVSATSHGSKTIALTTTDGTSVLDADNFLMPTGEGINSAAMADASASGTKFYRLTMHNADPEHDILGTIGFWYGAEGGAAFDYNTANRAYLAVPSGAQAPARFWFTDEENGATNIEAVEAAEEAVKFIQDGKLFIKKNGVVYDMLGTIVR